MPTADGTLFPLLPGGQPPRKKATTPTPPIVRAIHRSGYDRQDNDYYPTPPGVTACLLRHVALRGPVWEPCCGDGAIAKVIAGEGHEVVATDLKNYGFGVGGVDFFACRLMPAGCGSLVTNPPYGDGGSAPRAVNVSTAMLRFVSHALAVTGRANGQLALLVRFQWIAGKRAARLISSAPLDTVLVLTKRIRWFEMGERTTTGQHHHAWIFFDYQRDASRSPRIVFAA